MTDVERNAISDQAVDWVIRMDAQETDDAVRNALSEWLAADPRHQGAFLRAQAAWHSLDRLQILPTAEPLAPVRVSRRAALAGGGAAIAASAVGAALFFRSRGQITTDVGEVRRVPLSDGSMAALNTNTVLAVDIKSQMRELSIDKGEAWFDVAKDKQRPFVVSAGDVRVRAVGTAFAVRRHSDGASVLVTEGKVETWSTKAPGEKAVLVAGKEVFVSDIAGPSQVVASAAKIDRALAWRAGEIALAGETLEEAAAEFNRYNSLRLTVDPSLQNKRLVGWFRTNEPETFAHAAAAMLGASVVVDDGEIHLAPQGDRQKN